MTSITRRGNLTLGTITSLFLFIVILSGCSSAGNVPVLSATQSVVVPTATSSPAPTETPVPPTETPDPFAGALGIDLEDDGSIDVYVKADGEKIEYATADGEWKMANKGEYLQIEGFNYKWVAETQELVRVYEHWNQCEVGITEESVNAQYSALVEETRNTWMSYSVGDTEWGMNGSDGNLVWFHLLDGFSVKKYKRNYETVPGAIFDKTLCLVNVNGNEFQVAVGYVPTREGSGWKRVATPVSVLTPDGLFVPFFRSEGNLQRSEVVDLGSQRAMAETWKNWDGDEFIKMRPGGLVTFADDEKGVIDLDEAFYTRYMTFFNWYFESEDPAVIAGGQDMNMGNFNIGTTKEEFETGIKIMVEIMQGGIDGKTKAQEISVFDFINENSPVGVWFPLDFYT